MTWIFCYNNIMILDKDYKRELERFFGFVIGLKNYSYGPREALWCINNNEYIPIFIFRHTLCLISVLKTSKSKYKDAFDQLIGEKPFCTTVSGVKFKTNKPVPSSYEELCIINDLMGN